MFDVFGSVKGLLNIDSVCIQNNEFQLHYKANVIIFVEFSLLIMSLKYIGNPIDCIVDEIPFAIMDTYFRIYSTFTKANRLGGIRGTVVAQSGVPTHKGNDEIK